MRKPVTVYPIKSNVKPDRAARKRASINSVGRLSGPLEFISFVEVPPVELISGNRKLLASSKWSGTALHPSWRKRVIAPLVGIDQEPKSDGYNPHDPLSLEEKVRDFFQSIHFQERSIEEDIANHLRSIYRRRRVPPIAPSSQRFLVIFSDNGGSLECVIQQNRVVPLVRPLEFRTTSSPIQGTTETSLTPSFSTMLNSRTDKSEQ